MKISIYVTGPGLLILGLLAGIAEPGFAADDFSPRLVAEGRAIYDELGCAGCHEPAEPVEGNLAPKLENLAERYTAEDIAALLDAPPGPMPRFDLDDEDKRALAAFLLTTF